MFFLLLTLGLLIYWRMFSGYFFMDDFYFLKISQANGIKEWFNLFIPIKFTPYRPVSQQLFFAVFYKIFDLNPFPYHFFILIVHIINAFLVYKISSYFIKRKKTGKLISLIYLVSSIHFVGLYSITGSYIVFGLFFTYLSFWFWLKFETLRINKFYYISLISFILAIFSAEISAVLALIILFISKNKNKFILLIPYWSLIVFNLVINYFWAGSPKNDAFNFYFNAIPNTFRWYHLRALGLPEGIKNGYLWEQGLLYLGFISLCLILITQLIKRKQVLVKHKRYLVKYLLWIIIGAFPFYFMPNHLNPIYFSLSFIGFLLILSLIISTQYFKFYTIIIIFMSMISINLLLHTHWTVQRSKLAKDWITKIINNKNTQQDNKLIINTNSLVLQEELKITLSDSRAFQLIFKNPKLQVIYQQEKELQ